MKPRFFFPALGLVAVLLAVFLRPSSYQPPAAPDALRLIPATAAPH